MVTLLRSMKKAALVSLNAPWLPIHLPCAHTIIVRPEVRCLVVRVRNDGQVKPHKFILLGDTYHHAYAGAVEVHNGGIELLLEVESMSDDANRP